MSHPGLMRSTSRRIFRIEAFLGDIPILQFSRTIQVNGAGIVRAIYNTGMYLIPGVSIAEGYPMAVKKAFSSFSEVINESDVPVLVDFYAPWCGPCKLMAQILEQVNTELKQKLRVVKINTDNYPNLASEYQVYNLPTLVLFKQGQPVDRIEGVMNAKQLMQRLNPML